MHLTAKSRYGIRIAVALTILVAVGIPAMAQEKHEGRNFTNPRDPGYESPIDNYDPWEGFNRAMYKFNYGFDKYFFIPVVDTYRFILPKVVRTGIANFFDNLYGVTDVANNLLQGDLEGTFNSSARIVFNSTIGIAGVLDPATPWGFPRIRKISGRPWESGDWDRDPTLCCRFWGLPACATASASVWMRPSIRSGRVRS